MCSNSPVAGLLGLVNSQQTFFQGGLPIYLRRKNFADNPAVDDLGFIFTPTTSGALVGTTDTLILPPPGIKLMSMVSVAMAAAAGAQVRAGARLVQVSDTFVKAQQALMGYKTPYEVWSNPSVVGLVTDSLLLEIIDIIHQDVYGQTLIWNLTCNASDLSAA